jgi:uncharacterized iron-regulated membrane protein
LRPTRQFWVICHRWAGLTIALFLAVAGFTGIFLAWKDELEAVIAPQLHVAAQPFPGAQRLDPLMIRASVLAAHPGAYINYAPLAPGPGRTLVYYLSRTDPKTGETGAWSRDWDEVFVNPYTGAIQGTRQWGDITQGSINLMPFIYRLHYSLALGDWGLLAFGIAALVWTADCFLGFYLTLPVRVRRGAGSVPAGRISGPRLWRRRWAPSWSVRWRSSAFKLNFDLHRAGGLWFWPLLLVFAWSGVAFNIPQVYAPVMHQFGAENARVAVPSLAVPQLVPAIPMEAARARGALLASRQMARRGMTAGAADSLSYDPGTGAYVYSFRSSRDFTDHRGWSSVLFSAQDGHLLGVELPAGQSGANTFTNWITALFGLPWRIAVSLIGGIVTMLSVTGVIIWMKKRSARIRRARLAV